MATSFRKLFNHVAETDCIARIFRRKLERENRVGDSVPVSRYSTRVPCKRDSDQRREREKFSAGSWNVVRTDVTRTANYLRMFRLRRVSRSLPICIIIGRTFNAGDQIAVRICGNNRGQHVLGPIFPRRKSIRIFTKFRLSRFSLFGELRSFLSLCFFFFKFRKIPLWGSFLFFFFFC